MRIEEFESISGTLMLAKDLHDAKRFDVVEKHFFNTLDEDCFYENLINTIMHVFSDCHFAYEGDDDIEHMIFHDDVISDYFVYAWKYGKEHKLPHDLNPYVEQAEKAVRECLNVSTCTSGRVLGYTKTKKTAKKSALVVEQYTSCGCNANEGIAYGLIQMYTWFSEKCAEFRALEGGEDGKDTTIMPIASENHEQKEVIAA